MALANSTLTNSIAYVNGSVYTVDAAQPRAGGFVVSPEGIFTHVGSSEEISSVANQSRIIIVDLQGNFTMPGVHDAHMHLLSSGLGLTSQGVLASDTTQANLGGRVKEASCACEYINAFQDWVLAGMYVNQNFPNMSADRQYLDTMFPDRPVAVSGGAAHSMLLNTEALKRAGYDIENEPDAQGSKFFRRPDGSLTGEMGENAMAKAQIAISSPGRPHIKRALLRAIQLAHRAGVTSTQEANSNTRLLQALSEMEEEGTLKLDIQTHLVYGPEWVASEKKEASLKLLDAANDYKSKHVDTRFVKIILDGVPLPPLLTHAPLRANGTVDERNLQVPDVVQAVQEYDKRNMTIKIHCTGQGATRLALDAIEMARKNNPGGPKHEIAHNSGVNEEDYKRYGPLNVTAEMSPASLFTAPEVALSNGTMDFNFPKLMAAGAHLTIGSDWGAQPDPAVFEPLAGIVETVGNGSKEKGGEALCKMLTLNGAQAVGRANEVGSITVGKKANFIVMNQDLSKGEFASAKVMRTYFEGEKVWDAFA